MTERSTGYRGLARALALVGLLGAALAAMIGWAAHSAVNTIYYGTPTALPHASCGEIGTHELSGATRLFRAGTGSLWCFATAARLCQEESIAVTEMGTVTGTKYVFAIEPGQAPCQATEWSQGYSANSGGSQQFKVVVTQCSAAAQPDGVLLGCGGRDILIPATVANS
jgi:hypothetical protein